MATFQNFATLTYNGSYMIPEIILTAVAAVLVARLVLPRLPQPAAQ